MTSRRGGWAGGRLACGAAVVLQLLGCVRVVPDAPPVTLRLGGDVARIEGLAWPTKEGAPTKYQDVLRPLTLKIVYPSGRTTTTYSKVTFLEQKNGKLVRICLAPMRETAAIQETLAECESLARGLGLLKDKVFRKRLEGWKANPPRWNLMADQASGSEPESDVQVFVKIDPAEGRGTFYMSFEITYRYAED